MNSKRLEPDLKLDVKEDDKIVCRALYICIYVVKKYTLLDIISLSSSDLLLIILATKCWICK